MWECENMRMRNCEKWRNEKMSKNCSIVRLVDCSIVAALVVMAGCATEPECAKVEAAKAEPAKVEAKAAETKPADPFKTEYDKCMKIVRKWGMHSQPVEVLKDMPEVKAFVEAELKKPGHEKEMVELVMRTVETYDRARDFKSAVAFAEWLYANEKAHLGARLQAARYLAMKAVDEKKDYAAADAYYAKLAVLKPGNPFDRPAVAKRRAYLYTLRDDKAGAIKFLEAERAKLPERDTLGRGCFDEAIADVYGAFFDYAGKLKFWQDRGNRRQAMKVLTTGEVSDKALCTKIAREIVLEDKDLGARREREFVSHIPKRQKLGPRRFIRERQDKRRVGARIRILMRMATRFDF